MHLFNNIKEAIHSLHQSNFRESVVIDLSTPKVTKRYLIEKDANTTLAKKLFNEKVDIYKTINGLKNDGDFTYSLMQKENSGHRRELDNYVLVKITRLSQPHSVNLYSHFGKQG